MCRGRMPRRGHLHGVMSESVGPRLTQGRGWCRHPLQPRAVRGVGAVRERGQAGPHTHRQLAGGIRGQVGRARGAWDVLTSWRRRWLMTAW